MHIHLFTLTTYLIIQSFMNISHQQITKSMNALIFLLLSYFQINHAFNPSPGCRKIQPSEPYPGQYERFYFNYTDYRLGVVERNYIIQVPLEYTHGNPTPLVLDMHGFQGDASKQMSK